MKKIITKITGFLAVVFAGAAVMAPMAADTFAAPTGWVYNSAQKAYNYYGSNGKKYTGWHYMTKKEGEKKEHWNYFGSDGRLYTGWQWMDGGEGEKTPHWSYFGANGWLRTGWIQLGKGTAETDGNTAKHWSYFGANGWLRTNWVQLGKGTSEPDGNSAKHWSYFGANGWLREGMQDMGKGTNNPDGNVAKHKSYFGNNGWLVTDKTFTYSGKNYKADGRGWLSEVTKSVSDSSKSTKTTSQIKTNKTTDPAKNNKATEVAKYTVKFTDGNKKILSTQTVEKGKAASAPLEPTKEGYKFTGWDKSFVNVTNNITVNATWKKEPTLDELRKDLLALVNAERKKAGVGELKLNKYMNETAQVKAKDNYENNTIDHYSKKLGYVWNQFYNADIAVPNMIAAENNAISPADASVVMEVWMNSPGHRDNILLSYITDIGIGYYNGYWVQQFTRNPIKSHKVECQNCGHKTLEAALNYFGEGGRYDDFGNTLRTYWCNECEELVAVCPKCKKYGLLPMGYNSKGNVTYTCKGCQYVSDKKIVKNCSACGIPILEHSKGKQSVERNDTFNISFNYGPYWDENRVSQNISVEIEYCDKENKYIFVDDSNKERYEEGYKALQAKIKKGENIYDYIKWVKLTYPVTHEAGALVPVETDLKTPNIKSLAELLNKKRL